MRKTHPKHFFTEEEKTRIVQTIRQAEEKTSGEIRVHVSRRAGGDLMREAKKTFHRLGITKTKRRNGVLIYLAIANRVFAVLGDRGIHEKVGDQFWESVVAKMAPAFSRDDFAGGLVSGIREIGEKLKEHFPHESDDQNELPNKIE